MKLELGKKKRESEALALSKRKTAVFLFCTWVALSMCSIPLSVFGETPCERANILFNRSQLRSDPAAAKSDLEKAVRLCPQHGSAWNNLGFIYENEGQFDKAEEAYHRALKHDPDLGASLAGLGDIAAGRGHFQEAAGWYQKFLAFLSAEIEKGDPQGFSDYEEEYRQKYEQAKLRWQIHVGSITEVIPQTTLIRGLRTIRVKRKDYRPARHDRLPLYIHFDFDSAKLKPQGRTQLVEVALTMLSAELQAATFLIEGHSDTIGPAGYNFELSRRRAEKVRSFLISQGVEAGRLTTKGYGESRPIVFTGNKRTQAINRRVGFTRY